MKQRTKEIWYFFAEVKKEDEEQTEKALRDSNLLQRAGLKILIGLLGHGAIRRGVKQINEKGQTRIIWEKD